MNLTIFAGFSCVNEGAGSFFLVVAFIFTALIGLIGVNRDLKARKRKIELFPYIFGTLSALFFGFGAYSAFNNPRCGNSGYSITVLISMILLIIFYAASYVYSLFSTPSD
jgi:hypothetical protein